MAAIESYYRVDGNYSFPPKKTILKTEYSHDIKAGDNYNPKTESANGGGNQEEPFKTEQLGVIAHLNAIRDFILIREDYNLYQHLMKLDIPLHLFGM